MKTKREIHDSLYFRPIAKAALYAYLQRRAQAVQCGTTQADLRAFYVRQMDRISARFQIQSLVLDFQLSP